MGTDRSIPENQLRALAAGQAATFAAIAPDLGSARVLSAASELATAGLLGPTGEGQFIPSG